MKNYLKSILVLMLMFSAKAFSVPTLSSLPSATATIFIDFDGHTVISSSWGGGTRMVCAAPALTDAQMTEIFNRVAEDYRPFNINITTDSLQFLNAPLNRRIRIIVTPTSAWSPGVGGVAYIGSFVWGDDTPAFVFSDRLANSPKYIGECVTHESGHTVGLAHQSTYNSNCSLTEQYAMGTGSGETSWAPVMGNSYYRNMTGWNNGPTPYGCSNLQDNLTIITTQNGFSYRTDDHADALNTSATLLPSAFSVDGIISTSIDKDAFVYNVDVNSNFHIEAVPFRLNSANAGANLDIKMEVYNEALQLINTYDPSDKMHLVVDTTLNAGKYYFVLTGTGNANTADYGSLGSYTITGFKGALPIRSIVLQGNTDNGKHNLTWNIIADEEIKEQVIEISQDGNTFTTLQITGGAQRSLSITPESKSTTYYRLKATSVIDQTAYSNTIVLKSNNNTKHYTVSTLVQTEIVVNAPDNYDYLITDANGRMLQKGKGSRGTNRINIMNYASGMYIIQLVNNNQKQTERIIKQ